MFTPVSYTNAGARIAERLRACLPHYSGSLSADAGRVSWMNPQTHFLPHGGAAICPR